MQRFARSEVADKLEHFLQSQKRRSTVQIVELVEELITATSRPRAKIEQCCGSQFECRSPKVV